MRTITTRLAVLGLSSGLLFLPDTSALAGDLRIERIVPKETLLALGTDDFAQLTRSAQSTALWKVSQTDAFKKLIDRLSKEVEGEGTTLDEQLESLGLTRDDLVAPQGPVGAAVFLENNEELAIKQMQWLAVADFGDRAEAAQKVVDAYIESIAKDGNLVITEREIRGRKVRSIPLPPDADGMDDDDDMEFDMAFGELPDFTGHIDTLHVCRDGERLFVTSSLVALEDAIEVADGSKLDTPLAENTDFQASMRQLGDDRQAWAVTLTPAMQPLVAPLLAGPAAMAAPFITDLFGDIRAYSFGFSFDEGEKQARQSVGILVPGEKLGLVALLRDTRPGGDVPPSAGPDTVGFGRINVKFSGILPLAERIVKGLPPMFAEEAEMQLAQLKPMLEKAFNDLGPELYVVTTLEEPLTEESQRASVLIRNADPTGVRPMLDMFAPSMGLVPQDFVGQTIYGDEFADLAIGLGGGWVVIGGQDAVEGTLRATGQKDLPSIKEAAEFRRGVAVIPDTPLVGWGWTDMVASWKMMRFQNEMTAKILAEFAEMEGIKLGTDDEDPIAEFVTDLTPEELAKYVGPTVWWLAAEESGFTMRSVLLAPPAAPAER